MKYNHHFPKKYTLFLIPIIALIFFLFVFRQGNASSEKNYGVFLGIDREQITTLYDYQTVVIDAQYFTADDINSLHDKGITVYSYLNIGSLENFRDYYEQFKDLGLGSYENWEEEIWIDVSDADWQKQVIHLAAKLSEKGVDGYFIDNCDVYYIYPTEEIFMGLTTILQALRADDMPVIINGGDTYVTAYRDKYGSAADIMTGVNQECVFSKIDFEHETLSKNTTDDRNYFQEYIQSCADDSMDVYLLEYTSDEDLIAEIAAYCKKEGFAYYITDSIELS